MAHNHDTAWVIKHFRPLLDKIGSGNLPEEPQIRLELLAENRQYRQLRLEDCILTVRRISFGLALGGFYTFSTKEYEGQNFYILNICINSSLFVSEDTELSIKRRRTITHEFTHCIAAFLSISRITTKKLLCNLAEHLAHRVKINMLAHYQSLLVQFGNSPSTITDTLGIYPDEHFRLGYEDFEHSFSTVYKELILDKIIFEKYFTKDLQNDFNQAVKAGNTAKASAVLRNVLSMLVTHETISADFISLRLREELIEYYYQKAVA